MAQDTTIADVTNWAAQAYGSALAEGVTFMGYPQLAEMAQRPEYRVISETIAEEMTRKWIRITAQGDDQDDKADKIKQLEDELDRLRVQEAFRKVAEQDGFFGRGHLYLDTGDTNNPEELKTSIGDGSHLDPISKRKIDGKKKKLLAVRPVEAIWTYPTYYDSEDPLRDDWYEPQEWFVMGKQVHVSRLLRFVGREVPDLLKPAYSFGGLSQSQMVKPYVDNWLNTRQSVADIVRSFVVYVLATGMEEAALGPDGQKLMDRLDYFNAVRDNLGVMAIDKTREDFKNVAAPLGTLDSLQAQTQEHMAAIARIPLVKLLGITPNGLNATTDGEIRAFYDTIAAQQRRLFQRHLWTVLWFVQRSLWGDVDTAITFEWEPLWALDEKAQADMRKVEADTDAVYYEMGAVSGQEVRKKVATSKDSPYPGLDLDEEITPPGEEQDGEGGEKDPIDGFSRRELGLGQGGSPSDPESSSESFEEAAE